MVGYLSKGTFERYKDKCERKSICGVHAVKKKNPSMHSTGMHSTSIHSNGETGQEES
jgi:hypothetical protein